MLAHPLAGRLIGKPTVACAHVVDDMTYLPGFGNDTGNGWPATKLIYLALRNITAKWKNPPREWHAAKAQFAIQFGERFVLTV